MSDDRLKRMGEATFALYCDPFAIEFPSTAGWLDGSVKSRSFMVKNAALGPWERWVKVAGSYVHKWMPEAEAYYVVHAEWRTFAKQVKENP